MRVYPSYTILVKDSAGASKGVVYPIKKLSFGKRLNNYGHAQFEIQVEDSQVAELISLRKNTIEIYKETFEPIAYLLQEDEDFLLQENGYKIILDQSGSNSELVWAGEQASLDASLSDRGGDWITVHSFTWFEQLSARFTDEFERYENVDAGAAINTLIATTQGKTGGDFGITEGTIDTTYNIDIIYQNDNIADAIKGISDGGLDFRINDDKSLDASSILGEDKTSTVVFEYGINVRSMRISHDFKSPVNQAIVLGEVIGEDSLQRVDRTNTTLRTAYKLRQGRLNQMEASIVGVFNDKGDSLIRKYGVPLIKVDFDLIRNITPDITQFDVGDGVKLRVDHGYFSIDEEYRVFEWEVTINEDNSESLSLLLGKFTI